MTKTKSISLAAFLAPALLAAAAPLHADPAVPVVNYQRPMPLPSARPLVTGPALFVDAAKGNDADAGTKDKPWRTVNRGLQGVHPGDTLYLRGGVYYENVSVSTSGTAEKPITISSYPGELATINGGFREFFDSPATAWQPAADGAPDEYISTKAYPNIRDIVGHLGESRIGLQTYAHIEDLRSNMELWDEVKGTDVKPLYAGPGFLYDATTGRIRIRLAHTHLQGGITNYEGETDPRKLPIVIAPFRSNPLHVDGANNVRIQDVFIRGAGYDSVVVDNSQNVTFDGVVVRCGTYGMRVANTRGLRFLHSALNGNNPPWGFRNENSLRTRKEGDTRDLTRLTCHALWAIETGREWSVYAFPTNDDWEIAYSEFTDSHDGLYLGGIDVKFHNNLLENCHDDGIYISPMYPHASGDLYIYQNVFKAVLTCLASGGSEVKNDDHMYVFRNIFDLRAPTNYGRPTPAQPNGIRDLSNPTGDHGSPPWGAMNVYNNTFIVNKARDATMGTTGSSTPENPRRVFNNIFLHAGRLPAYSGPKGDFNLAEDGDLLWATDLTAPPAAYFDKFRATPAYEASKKGYPDGSTTHSLVADPQLGDDYRPKPGSPAIDAGVPIPAEWPDPLRDLDKGKPDIGALPADAPPLKVGRNAN